MKYMAIILLVFANLAACDGPKEEDPTTGEAAEEDRAAPETAPGAEEAEQKLAANDRPDGAKEPGALAEDLEPGEEGFYGDRFTVIEPPIQLAEAVEQASDHEGPFKVEATVQRVCKKKGCWFTMSDGSMDEEIRVRMKDYGFFVPRNADGASVVAEGTLQSREVPQDEAQHYADDEAEAGEEPRKVEGPQQVWEFTATAIQMNAAEG